MGPGGLIASFVVAHRSFHPAFGGKVPYVVAEIIVDGTANEMALLSNVVGSRWTEVRVGQRVRVLFEDVTNDVTLPKFRVS